MPALSLEARAAGAKLVMIMITYLALFGAPEDGAERVEMLGDLAVFAPRHARHYLESEITKEYGLRG